MSKKIPADALVILYNKLESLAPRSNERKAIVNELAGFYGVSIV